jgi:hypothetical protein
MNDLIEKLSTMHPAISDQVMLDREATERQARLKKLGQGKTTTELESVHLLQQSVNRLARCKEQLSMIEDKLSGPREVSEPSNVENLKMLRDMLNEFGAVLALLRIEIDA